MCPKTGQPDFWHNYLHLYASRSLRRIELKSLKLYLQRLFANQGIFYENVVNRLTWTIS